MIKINTFELWYENQEKHDKPFLIQTILTVKQMSKIVIDMKRLRDKEDYDNFDSEIIKEIALQKDPNYKELKIDGSIEY